MFLTQSIDEIGIEIDNILNQHTSLLFISEKCTVPLSYGKEQSEQAEPQAMTERIWIDKMNELREQAVLKMNGYSLPINCPVIRYQPLVDSGLPQRTPLHILIPKNICKIIKQSRIHSILNKQYRVTFNVQVNNIVSLKLFWLSLFSPLICREAGPGLKTFNGSNQLTRKGSEFRNQVRSGQSFGDN